ncbi:VOC family protein [Fodinibius sp. SL11]|uniref:VOC family protein n=1 Tax=Fodinibius sp. SL11 TaxID=3425690 RepID=UPI003F884DDC
MSNHEKINYVEFPSSDLLATKKFFKEVFEWSFKDYGPEYTAFSNSGLDGGFFKSSKHTAIENGSALVVLYSNDLEATQTKIQQSGGKITKSIFPFPGGRRFHFVEPGGNELAVWSDQ